MISEKQTNLIMCGIMCAATIHDAGYFSREDSYSAEKELKEILIDDFAEKVQNKSANIDLSIFNCYNDY